jgi:hypothetical protein
MFISKIPSAFFLALFLMGRAGGAHAEDLAADNCDPQAGERPRFCVQTTIFGTYELKELASGGIPLTISLKGTTLDKYDLKNIAAAGPLTVLANSDRLGKYDLIELARAGATVHVIGNASDLPFGKYDLLELASAGVKLNLTIDAFKFSQYDLRELAAAGALQVTYRSSRRLYSKQDLKEIVSGKAELYLLVDDASFNKYDLLELARAGLRLN